MKTSRIVFALLTAAVLTVSAAGCAGTKSISYQDGTYSGRSSDHKDDEDGNGSGYGEAEIIVKKNKITACTFKTYELDGTLKDENYGAELTQENRLKAQKAVQANERYAQLVVKSGSLDGVDAISGATISYQELKEAVNDALKKAEADT